MPEAEARTYLVTGGCGFIGSALVRSLIADGANVVNVDSMTYAATTGSTASVRDNDRYHHELVDIVDRDALQAVFRRHSPDVVVHLAAESHVDRSIDAPHGFVSTNVVGTVNLLDVASEYLRSRDGSRPFLFHHVSTDEVFGALGPAGRFDRESPYAPRSPYAASKASADHFVRAWHESYGLPVVISNCSNNYGPYQQPEKLIPMTIVRCMLGRDIPVYGDGSQVRDWLHVADHVAALRSVHDSGSVGSTYLIGGDAERTNLDVVTRVRDLVGELHDSGGSKRSEIAFVADRPGHDFRYAIDSSETATELGWSPRISFDDGLRATVGWYLDNRDWWEPLISEGATERRGNVERIQE